MKRPCTKDTEFRFLCSCDECSRAAAGSWSRLMDKVFDGSMTLTDAQGIDDAAKRKELGA